MHPHQQYPYSLSQSQSYAGGSRIPPQSGAQQGNVLMGGRTQAPSNYPPMTRGQPGTIIEHRHPSQSSSINVYPPGAPVQYHHNQIHHYQPQSQPQSFHGQGQYARAAYQPSEQHRVINSPNENLYTTNNTGVGSSIGNIYEKPDANHRYLYAPQGGTPGINARSNSPHVPSPPAGNQQPSGQTLTKKTTASFEHVIQTQMRGSKEGHQASNQFANAHSPEISLKVNQNLGNRGDSLQNSNNNLYVKIGSRDQFNLASNPGPEGPKKFSGQDSPDPSSMSQHLQASIGQQHPNDYSIRTIVEQEGDSRLLETHQDLTSVQVKFFW
jgi:hypothetical protein